MSGTFYHYVNFKQHTVKMTVPISTNACLIITTMT